MEAALDAYLRSEKERKNRDRKGQLAWTTTLLDGADPPRPALTAKARTLALVAHTTPREADGKAILPAWAAA